MKNEVERFKISGSELRACEHAGFKELLVAVADDKVGAVVIGPVLLAQVFKTDGGRARDVRGRRLLGSYMKSEEYSGHGARLRNDGEEDLGKSRLLLGTLQEGGSLQTRNRVTTGFPFNTCAALTCLRAFSSRPNEVCRAIIIC